MVDYYILQDYQLSSSKYINRYIESVVIAVVLHPLKTGMLDLCI